VNLRVRTKLLVGSSLFLAWTASNAVPATKDTQPPDREMLKMMEFLRDMEMIKQMEMLQDMQHLETVGDSKTAPQKTAPVKKKESVK
jgi:hypothetical protein